MTTKAPNYIALARAVLDHAEMATTPRWLRTTTAAGT